MNALGSPGSWLDELWTAVREGSDLSSQLVHQKAFCPVQSPLCGGGMSLASTLEGSPSTLLPAWNERPADFVCHHRKIPHPARLASTSLQLWTRCAPSICYALAPAAVKVSLRSEGGEGCGYLEVESQNLRPIPSVPCRLLSMLFRGVHLIWRLLVRGQWWLKWLGKDPAVGQKVGCLGPAESRLHENARWVSLP